MNARHQMISALVIIAAVGCGTNGADGPGSADAAADTPDAGDAQVGSTLDALAVASSDDLPACDAKHDGQLAYVADEGALYACLDGAWSPAELELPSGAQGERGPTGAAGRDSLVTVSAEAKGANCPAGGRRIDLGLDDDGDGTLDADEIDDTSYVCDGLQGLVAVTDEPKGIHCAATGKKIESGLDDGMPSGTAGNGVLEAGEVDNTAYSCLDADQFCSITDNADGTATVACPGGATAVVSSCGDGIVSASEQCEDGNTARCDGCEACERRSRLVLPSGTFGFSNTTASALSTNDATYEAWLRFDTGAFGVAFGSFGTGDFSAHFAIGCENAAWYFYTNAAANLVNFFNYTPATTCADGVWHHVAATRDVNAGNATFTLFVDGAVAGSATVSLSYVSAPSTLLLGGGRDTTSGYWPHTGALRIDELRISDAVRYTAAFTPARRFSHDGATTVLYHFDEISGNTAPDVSGHGHAATVNGSSWEVDDGYSAALCQ